MKVKDLIEQLGYMDAEADVHFSYNYGDHWRTQVAPKVGSIEEGVVTFSDYHRMDKIEEDEDEIYDEDTGDYKEGVRKVVVLG
jgi:hypothetical protein